VHKYCIKTFNLKIMTVHSYLTSNFTISITCYEMEFKIKKYVFFGMILEIILYLVNSVLAASYKNPLINCSPIFCMKYTVSFSELSLNCHTSAIQNVNFTTYFPLA
jgi:hypothetical protein